MDYRLSATNVPSLGDLCVSPNLQFARKKSRPGQGRLRMGLLKEGPVVAGPTPSHRGEEWANFQMVWMSYTLTVFIKAMVVPSSEVTIKFMVNYL